MDDGGDVSIIEILDLDNDHFYYTPISCRGTNTKDAISVEKYTEDKELHQAIMASIQGTQQIIDLTEEDEVIEVKSISSFRKKTLFFPSFIETGESSSSKDSSFICKICVEPKAKNQSFSIKGCTYFFCSDCMVKYVASKIQENVTSIRCPEIDCKGVLEPEFCRSILPTEVFNRWGDALCESSILGSEKFYCPFKDCSSLLVNDGGMVVKESECPYCWRLFCAQCKVPWHLGIECEEFQKLNEDERGREDIMMMKLAKKSKWQRCPMCKFYVERSQGCLFMKCRCGFTFCYNCGAPLKDHYCSNCGR